MNTRKNNILFWLVFSIFNLLVVRGKSQNRNIQLRGTVLDSASSHPIENAIISLRSEGTGRIVAFTHSDANGAFSIVVSSANTTSVYLQASMMGYATGTQKIEPAKASYQFSLHQQAIELKEVKVKSSPPPITQRHDTLSYKVSAFSNAQDRTIGEVLKKMPGMEVSDDGIVRYNGKPINKFYIEGLDLLDRKYGIAVNNVTAKDVDNVEVLQNHQPIRALEDKVYSDQAAINLKLKESAKSKWLGTVDAETGVTPFLWKGEAMAMQVRSGTQSINTFKSNNAGQDVTRELRALNIEDILNGMDNIVVDGARVNLQASSPPVREERSLFNRTWSGTLNRLHVFRNEMQLRTNLSLSDDRRTGQKSSNTLYFLGNGDSLAIDERQDYRQHDRRAEGALTLNVNKKSFYINDQLKTQAYFSKMDIATLGTAANTQSAKMPVHFLENDFSLVKPLGSHILKVGSFAHYGSMPQSLFVSLGSGDSLGQKDHEQKLYLHNYAAYSIPVLGMSLDMKGGVKWYRNRYHTDFTMDAIFPDSGHANIVIDLTQAYFRPSLAFARGRWRMGLRFPVRYSIFSMKSHSDINKDGHSRYFHFLPQLDMTFQPNGYWKLAAGAGYDANLSVDNLPDRYVLSDYRTLFLGTSKPVEEKKKNISLGATYQNPVKELFLYVGGSYSPSDVNYLSSYSFEDYLRISSQVLADNSKRVFRLNFRVSKGIDALKSTVALLVNYNFSQSEAMQQGVLQRNTLKTLSLTPKLDGQPLSWLTIGYEGQLVRNWMRLSTSQDITPLNRFNQNCSVGIIPGKSWNFKYSLEHFYAQLSPGQSSNMVFSDVQLRYIPQKWKGVELNINAYNLFNEKQFRYAILNDASYTQQTYRIRPFNILMGIYFKW
ncbi:MAG: carboxypeptidase regulatory-like domain-containing protein [Chitinophagaceae bacterium]